MRAFLFCCHDRCHMVCAEETSDWFWDTVLYCEVLTGEVEGLISICPVHRADGKA